MVRENIEKELRNKCNKLMGTATDISRLVEEKLKKI